MGGHKLEQIQIRSLYEQLQGASDYRGKRGRRYEAATVLVIVLLAKLAGEESVSGIAQWARLPCANTYAYICTYLDMCALNTQLAL